MNEPKIEINGVTLTDSQTIAVRIAVESLGVTIEDGLGDDDYARQLAELYRSRIEEVRDLMYPETGADLGGHPR